MNLFRLLSLSVCCITAYPLHVQAIAPEIAKPIENALKRKCLAKNNTAVHIVSVPEGKTVFEKNANKPLLPASTMKIVTSAAALHYLGPEYRFKTKILHTGPQVNGEIKGDLIIQGGGDPKLRSADLREISARLKSAGIWRVTGDLVADDTFFDGLDRAPSWKEKRSRYRYDAGLSALSLNFNSVDVHVKPGKRRGSKVVAWLNPAPAYMKIINAAETGKRRSRNTIWADRKEQGDALNIVLRGRLPQSVGERMLFLNVKNPTRYAAESFRSILQETGIEILGKTVIAATPENVAQIHEHHSPPLSLILKELNTYSNNFVAEQVLKTMAAHQTNSTGTHANGLSLMKQFLQLSGVDLKNVELADASGLSRQNRLTAKTLTHLLAAMPGRFDIGPDFMAALRVMGADGISSKRFKNSPARGQVRAKTGSLNGVSTLAGYVPGKDGGLYAYALFLTQNRCGHHIADRVEDRIVNAIHTGK
ncbi:MAG: D-alanyl-D-alanine carboxypeptidase/D-alanyl-D-alanine-endopeptidase [Pseudomonadota bacterium]